MYLPLFSHKGNSHPSLGSKSCTSSFMKLLLFQMCLFSSVLIMLPWSSNAVSPSVPIIPKQSLVHVVGFITQTNCKIFGFLPSDSIIPLHLHTFEGSRSDCFPSETLTSKISFWPQQSVPSHQIFTFCSWLLYYHTGLAVAVSAPRLNSMVKIYG